MALEKKVFVGGGMDKDTDSRFVAKTDYREAHNVRISSSDEGNEGIVENIRSNLLITNANLTALGCKVIGAHEDLDNKKVYYFVAGPTSSGGNAIYQYDTSTEVVTTVLQDSLLNFNTDFLITGVNLIGTDEDRFPLGLLYFTDDLNPPRKINIDKAIRYTSSGGTDPEGYQTISFDSLDAIKHPPFFQPSCQTLNVNNVFLTDTNTISNQLKQKSWQFKYRWVYDDGEISSWSPNSLVHTNNDFDAFFNSGTTSFTRNVLPVTFNTGGELVKRIQIATRNTNDMDDWLLVCDIKKSYLKEKVGPTFTTIAPFATGASLPDGQDFVFYFYNDGIYNTVDVVESAKLYNDVPHLAKAQEVVDGNRLVYGNVVTGQTVDTELDVSLTPGNDGESDLSTDIGTTINLNWQMSTRGDWLDLSNLSGGTTYAGNQRVYRSTHRIRFEVPDICAAGIAQYNLQVTDWFIGHQASKNRCWSTTGAAELDLGLAIVNINYQSSPYTPAFGNALAIAGDMASQLNQGGTQAGSTDVRPIIGGRIASATLNSDRVVTSNNFTGTFSWSAYDAGGTIYLECQIVGQAAQWMPYSSVWPFPFSPSLQGTPGVQGSSGQLFGFSVPFGSNNTYQWGQMTSETGCYPLPPLSPIAPVTGGNTRGRSFSAFPGAPGASVALQNLFFVAQMAGSSMWEVGTPNQPVASSSNIAPGSVWGMQNISNSSLINFLQGVQSRIANGAGGVNFINESICPDVTGPPAVAVVPTFKTGARHRFGLVYYDRALRSSSVQLASDSEVYIPRMAESTTLNPNGYTGEWYIDWAINHPAPDWAEYWQWVYGGNTLTDDYYQFVCPGIYRGVGAIQDINSRQEDRNTDKDRQRTRNAVTAPDYSANLLVDMSALNNYVLEEGGEAAVYNFEEGDMLRIVSDANDNPAVNEAWEFKILGKVGFGKYPLIDWDASNAGAASATSAWNPNGEYRELLVLANETALLALFQTGVTAVLQDYTMEVYSPKRKTKEKFQIYNEFGHVGRCVNVGGVNCHSSVIGDVSPNVQSQDFNASIPAQGRFTRGDAYYRIRASKSNKLFTPMESFHFTDKYTSDFWDKGRPNAVLEDFRRTRKHSTVLYSEPYVPNTYINGLHSFFPDVSFQEFERSYNSIQKLHSKDNSLIIFQEDKVSKSLIKRDIIYNVDGSGNVATSDVVVSQAVPYLGDYGICKNPESFASHGLRMYFYDVRRGCVLRLSQDGFTVISENKMKEYFTDKSEEILALPKNYKYNVYGVYDKRFEEYIIAFEEHLGNAPLDPQSLPAPEENTSETARRQTTVRTNLTPTRTSSTTTSSGGGGGY